MPLAAPHVGVPGVAQPPLDQLRSLLVHLRKGQIGVSLHVVEGPGGDGRGAVQRPGDLVPRELARRGDVVVLVRVVVAQPDPHPDQRGPGGRSGGESDPVGGGERVDPVRGTAQVQRRDEDPVDDLHRDRIVRADPAARPFDPPELDGDAREVPEVRCLRKVVERDVGIGRLARRERAHGGAEEELAGLELVRLERCLAVALLRVVAHPLVELPDVVDRGSGPMPRAHVGPLHPGPAREDGRIEHRGRWGRARPRVPTGDVDHALGGERRGEHAGRDERGEGERERSDGTPEGSASPWSLRRLHPSCLGAHGRRLERAVGR